MINWIKSSKTPLIVGAAFVVALFVAYVLIVGATRSSRSGFDYSDYTCPDSITNSQCDWVNYYTVKVLADHPEDTRAYVRKFWITYLEKENKAS